MGLGCLSERRAQSEERAVTQAIDKPHVIRAAGQILDRPLICTSTTMPEQRAGRTDGPGTSQIDRLWNAVPMVGGCWL